MPKVSIVVPVYNAARFLEDTIRSVQAQTEKDWELLLVDDCSTDESCDVITRISESDSRVRLIRQAQNAGAAAARNRGICEAAGKYLAYLDADDLWKPERLSKELAFLEKEKAAFVFCGYEFADENGRGTGKVVRVPKTLAYRQALKNTTIFIWSYQAPASSTGRIIIPLWGCEAQWFDNALNLTGDLRQQDFYYDCSAPNEPEQKMNLIILSGVFEKYVAKLDALQGTLKIGLQDWFDYWTDL